MKKIAQATKPQKESNIVRNWHLVDLSNKILGRATTEIAKLLQGKHKVDYISYLDSGDYVVVVNAGKVKLSGNKSQAKVYTRYSGYPGGQTRTVFHEAMRKNPADVVRHAVSGMLPKNKLRDRRLTRLYIFRDERHPYQAKFEVKKSK